MVCGLSGSPLATLCALVPARKHPTARGYASALALRVPGWGLSPLPISHLQPHPIPPPTQCLPYAVWWVPCHLRGLGATTGSPCPLAPYALTMRGPGLVGTVTTPPFHPKPLQPLPPPRNESLAVWEVACHLGGSETPSPLAPLPLTRLRCAAPGWGGLSPPLPSIPSPSSPSHHPGMSH